MEKPPSKFGAQLSVVGTQPRPKPTGNKATQGQVSFCKPAARGLPKLTTDVKQLVLDHGADFVGIASAEAMNASAQPFQTPEENLPGAHVVISFGVEMLDAIFESPNIRVAGMSYNRYHDKFDEMAWAISEYLEKEGHPAESLKRERPHRNCVGT